MSKQDRHFLNVFSVVIGVLVAIAIVLIAISRGVGLPFEQARSSASAELAAAAAENTAPVGHVAVAGQDNRALAIAADAAPAAALAALGDAESVFKSVCSGCHATGAAGAPRVGDHAAWGPRIGQGKATLYEHALKGFTGRNGIMLAKGGRADLADALVRQTVDYMVRLSQ